MKQKVFVQGRGRQPNRVAHRHPTHEEEDLRWEEEKMFDLTTPQMKNPCSPEHGFRVRQQEFPPLKVRH